ncbi:hypothetical protein [Deinococcus budaensis]|uniref:Uncharacterized protein n=1 Tax=Deinococcus budaensis TaxID=1665626 RepID=A0A7W8GFR7_9DEIO|nr:hypothetical protein [Deinococcus budaensis]MBB5234849.1 hypothetical protein [Deinococcus budaensis]
MTAAELKSKYDDLIREAVLKAYPDVDITRADEIAMPGSISSDIVARIIHSDFVIADVTYPNPNVFYELGLRHASRVGTIIIKDRSGPRVPFDIAHLRYIEYDNTPTGLKELSSRLRDFITYSTNNPDKPDNHFLEFAKYTKHKFYDFSDQDQTDEQGELMLAIFRSPDLMNLVMRASKGEEIPQEEFFRAIASDPEAAGPLIKAIAKGAFNAPQNQAQPNRQARRKKN